MTYEFALPSVNYTLQPGHRLMVQVQSSWFPLYDRNPQAPVPDVFPRPARRIIVRRPKSLFTGQGGTLDRAARSSNENQEMAGSRGDSLTLSGPRFWRPMLYQLSYTPVRRTGD